MAISSVERSEQRSLSSDPGAPPARTIAGTSRAALPRRILALADFERAARRHLPRPIFGYVAGAAETNASLDDNRGAFAEFGFVPRVLTDVSQRSQATTLLGHDYAAPFGIAPMGISALVAYRGDLVLARGGPGEHPDDHERLVVDPARGGRGGGAGLLVPGLPPR